MELTVFFKNIRIWISHLDCANTPTTSAYKSAMRLIFAAFGLDWMLKKWRNGIDIQSYNKEKERICIETRGH